MEYFEVAVDLPRGLLQLTLRGVWDEDTFDRFAAEYVAAMNLLEKRGGCLRALVDGSTFGTQDQAISSRFRALTAGQAPIAAERTATIVPADLAGVADMSCSGIFTDRRQAIDWLLEDAR